MEGHEEGLEPTFGCITKTNRYSRTLSLPEKYVNHAANTSVLRKQNIYQHIQDEEEDSTKRDESGSNTEEQQPEKRLTTATGSENYALKIKALPINGASAKTLKRAALKSSIFRTHNSKEFSYDFIENLGCGKSLASTHLSSGTNRNRRTVSVQHSTAGKRLINVTSSSRERNRKEDSSPNSNNPDSSFQKVSSQNVIDDRSTSNYACIPGSSPSVDSSFPAFMPQTRNFRSKCLSGSLSSTDMFPIAHSSPVETTPLLKRSEKSQFYIPIENSYVNLDAGFEINSSSPRPCSAVSNRLSSTEKHENLTNGFASSVTLRGTTPTYDCIPPAEISKISSGCSFETPSESTFNNGFVQGNSIGKLPFVDESSVPDSSSKSLKIQRSISLAKTKNYKTFSCSQQSSISIYSSPTMRCPSKAWEVSPFSDEFLTEILREDCRIQHSFDLDQKILSIEIVKYNLQPVEVNLIISCVHHMVCDFRMKLSCNLIGRTDRQQSEEGLYLMSSTLRWKVTRMILHRQRRIPSEERSYENFKKMVKELENKLIRNADDVTARLRAAKPAYVSESRFELQGIMDSSITIVDHFPMIPTLRVCVHTTENSSTRRLLSFLCPVKTEETIFKVDQTGDVELVSKPNKWCLRDSDKAFMIILIPALTLIALVGAWLWIYFKN